MIVIGLTTNVASDAALKAITEASLTDQDIVWHSGATPPVVYQYFELATSGDFAPDDQTEGTGFWHKELTMEGLDLAGYKTLRYKQIDANTRYLIRNGFTYSSKTFSMSNEAQKNWNRIKDNESEFTFPLKISKKNSDEYSLAQANVTAFWQAFNTALHVCLDSGRTLKKTIFDAVDEDAVAAVIDER